MASQPGMIMQNGQYTPNTQYMEYPSFMNGPWYQGAAPFPPFPFGPFQQFPIQQQSSGMSSAPLSNKQMPLEQVPSALSADQSAFVADQDFAQATKQETELSWEERTRQAWERLRNGVVETFSSAEPCKGGKNTEQEKTESGSIQPLNKEQAPHDVQQQHVKQTDATPGNLMQSSSFQRDQPTPVPIPQLYQQQPVQPVGILRNGPERRVTFGPPTEQIFEDDQDENYFYTVEPHGKKTKKKKKMKFRGRKILTGLFGRNKGHENLEVKPSTSIDVTASNSLSTEEWDDNYSYNEDQTPQPHHHRMMQQHPSYYHHQQYYPAQPPYPTGNYGYAGPSYPMMSPQQLQQYYATLPLTRSESPAPALPPQQQHQAPGGNNIYMPQQPQQSGIYYQQ